MSIEKEIETAIDNSLADLNIIVDLDSDGDLEITLFHGEKQLSQSFIGADVLADALKNHLDK